jgi:hypothetical protein
VAEDEVAGKMVSNNDVEVRRAKGSGDPCRTALASLAQEGLHKLCHQHFKCYELGTPRHEKKAGVSLPFAVLWNNFMVQTVALEYHIVKVEYGYGARRQSYQYGVPILSWYSQIG